MKRQERTGRLEIRKQVVLFITLITVFFAWITPTKVFAQEISSQQSSQQTKVVYPPAYQVYPPEVIKQWLIDAKLRIEQRTPYFRALGIAFPIGCAADEEEQRQIATGTIVSTVPYIVNDYGKVADAATGMSLARCSDGIYRPRQTWLNTYDPYADYLK